MEEFRTNIFEPTKEKGRKRLMYNFVIFGTIAGIWVLYFIGFPLIGLKTAIAFSIVVLGVKLYDDKYMGISAYGDRKAILVIAEQYLEIRDIRIPYSPLRNRENPTPTKETFKPSKFPAIYRFPSLDLFRVFTDFLGCFCYPLVTCKISLRLLDSS